MKRINNYILEKLVINKHSKIKRSLSNDIINTATAEFNDPKELSKWKPNEFDKIIVDFISEYITITPFYLWEYELDSEEMNDFYKMYNKHLKELQIYNLPSNQIKTKSMVNDAGTSAYANIFTNDNGEKYIMINVLETYARKMITIIQQ